MKLLITGASGLLGAKLSELAIRERHEVYSAYYQHKPLYGTPIHLDISDNDSVERTFKKIAPEGVVHAAALTDVDKCETQKELAWSTNVEGTRNIAESCRDHNAFLIYISTDYVFDGEKGMYKEIDKPSPINNYGLTKLKAEEIVKNLAEDYCIARGSVIYGAIRATGKTNFALWLIQKLKAKEKVRIVTDQWNSPTLNTNLAAMILEVLEQKLKGTFHLAGSTRLSRFEFAGLLVKTFSLDARLLASATTKEMSWLAKRPQDSSMNVDKALQTLKNKPLEISDALRKMKREMRTER